MKTLISVFVWFVLLIAVVLSYDEAARGDG